MNIILVSVDALLCALVMTAAVEYLRKIRPVDQPLLSLSFYLVAIAAFGSFVEALHGQCVSSFTVMLHAGVVLYAWARRDYVFQQILR
ncbi:hypothetical protein NUH87_26735 [Pseudomonas batumici]|uniref:hypothetical protein n=1 Tax=Pseudomonas batumici TaxID=226910 RepID=UPI0030D01A7B